MYKMNNKGIKSTRCLCGLEGKVLDWETQEWRSRQGPDQSRQADGLKLYQIKTIFVLLLLKKS